MCGCVCMCVCVNVYVCVYIFRVLCVCVCKKFIQSVLTNGKCVCLHMCEMLLKKKCVGLGGARWNGGCGNVMVSFKGKGNSARCVYHTFLYICV